VILVDSAPRSERVSLFLPSLAGGGAERVFVELANGFAERGVAVDLVLACASGPYVNEICGAVRVVDLGCSGVLRAIPRLARYLARERPAALLSALDHANVAAVIARLISVSPTRCVVSMRSMPRAVYEQMPSVRARLLLQLMKITYPLAEGIVANAQAVARDLAELLGSDPEITVIYNPLHVDRIERLSREDVGHPWAAAGAPPIVLSVGSLTPLKDFITLARAFTFVRAQRPCRLVILGEGPERSRIEGVLRDSGIQADAYLPGFIGNPYPWMRRAGVFVSSSVTEGCPNALMQAMACGAAVVSTDCAGGSAEILEQGKWGRLVPVRDPQAMAGAIGAALDAPSSTQARRRALDFAPERILQRYLAILLPGSTTACTGG
jgi:glycosyltransferase involved in cell wall biosynthesis